MADHGLVTLYNVKCTFAQQELTVLKFQAGNFLQYCFSWEDQVIYYTNELHYMHMLR